MKTTDALYFQRWLGSDAAEFTNDITNVTVFYREYVIEEAFKLLDIGIVTGCVDMSYYSRTFTNKEWQALILVRVLSKAEIEPTKELFLKVHGRILEKLNSARLTSDDLPF